MSVRSSDVEGVDLVILLPTRDLGDHFTVRRALPSVQRRMVGPFIFFNRMGPAAFRGARGLDVRPHTRRITMMRSRPVCIAVSRVYTSDHRGLSATHGRSSHA